MRSRYSWPRCWPPRLTLSALCSWCIGRDFSSLLFSAAWMAHLVRRLLCDCSISSSPSGGRVGDVGMLCWLVVWALVESGAARSSRSGRWLEAWALAGSGVVGTGLVGCWLALAVVVVRLLRGCWMWLAVVVVRPVESSCSGAPAIGPGLFGVFPRALALWPMP